MLATYMGACVITTWRVGLQAPLVARNYIITKKEREIVRKSNAYKLIIAMISCPGYMWAIRIKAPYLLLIKSSAMFFE